MDALDPEAGNANFQQWMDLIRPHADPDLGAMLVNDPNKAAQVLASRGLPPPDVRVGDTTDSGKNQDRLPSGAAYGTPPMKFAPTETPFDYMEGGGPKPAPRDYRPTSPSPFPSNISIAPPPSWTSAPGEAIYNWLNPNPAQATPAPSTPPAPAPATSPQPSKLPGPPAAVSPSPVYPTPSGAPPDDGTDPNAGVSPLDPKAPAKGPDFKAAGDALTKTLAGLKAMTPPAVSPVSTPAAPHPDVRAIQGIGEIAKLLTLLHAAAPQGTPPGLGPLLHAGR